MTRVNIFAMTKSIASQESISHPDVKTVDVNVTKELPKDSIAEPDHVEADDLTNAAVSNTQTSEPGPKDGGGDGTAHTVNVKEVTTKVDVTDVSANLVRDQNGGRHIDTLPDQVHAKDGLSASDVRTSVEEHDESGAETTDLKTIDSAGAEPIETADSMVMDLDGEDLAVTGMTDVTEGKLAECDSVAAKAESLSKATATVEKYHGLMQRMHKEGRYMSDELRQSISWALEDIDGQLFQPERAALESFNPKSRVSLEANEVATTGDSSGPKPKEGTIDDGADPGEVGKGLGAKFKQLFQAGVKIFWRFVNMVADLIVSFAQDAGKIKNHLADLRKRVNVLEGGAEFTMKGAGRLTMGGEFVGDSKAAIARVHKVSEELLMNWPTSLTKIIEEWKGNRGFFKSGTPTGQMMDALDQALTRAFRSFDRLNSGDKGKVPSGFMGVDQLSWSGVLPGDMALYYGVEKSKAPGEMGSIEDAQNAAKLNFSLVPGGDPQGGDVSVTTPTAGEAVSVIRELEKLCQFIVDAKAGMAKLKQFASESSTGAFMDLISGRGGQTGQINGLIVLGLAKTSTESQHRYIGWVINLVKGYIGFLEASLKAEAGGREDIQGN
jgi:hypothetical protein